MVAGKMMEDWSRRRRAGVLVRKISPNFPKALANYFGTGPTDVDASIQAHDNYVNCLQDNGLEVTILPSLADYPDCCFVEDAAVIVDGAAVICNLGHPSRQGEVGSIEEALSQHLETIVMPEGTKLDGGDVVFYDDYFLIGRSTRTNARGVEFMENICHKRGFKTFVFDVPSSTLHLSTICSSPAPGILVTAEGHLRPEQFDGITADIIWVPNEESYAANTIGFENGCVIVSEGYPKTADLLSRHGFSVTTIDMEHIRCADGSLTCLRLFFR
ncbi:MAG TPA: N(G),N(G)-dimethylarginine dimethylaminohydrolase [Candidatus Poseidoniales archaeon]|nr:N(G),N(G)-dimethylarginine dimethylaminohydrolase [Candidatus Poseidoniales archaeon]